MEGAREVLGWTSKLRRLCRGRLRRLGRPSLGVGEKGFSDYMYRAVELSGLIPREGLCFLKK